MLFLFLLDSCACLGLWFSCLMSTFAPSLVCYCCCGSAVVALTRGDMSAWVPGLIAATRLIVFLCYSLIDSLDSRGIPTGTQRQTNLGGQSITDARVTAQHSCWLRFSGNACVCVLYESVSVWKTLLIVPSLSVLTGIFCQSPSTCFDVILSITV